ncbi:glycosyl transferase [Sanguibacter keddieii DSM 10542]|uniref:Glycosyl transferase n=1 Tax=Sanguibacter keddieii (strain ATCC 51767 / DSM 10542 / NCFB 3025 / ST-74) TaxID=446469 RepID=D1BDU0_SANKS|nr:glycosyltransferase [Sanguibacter keddieii]ACZ23161.1 glycosyl transferase [Sanguibacter keddieii DSM 10542]
MIVLVPAYEPSRTLVELVGSLATHPGVRVVVVDDGSGPAYASVFDATRAAGATVLTHPANRGKGAALRTGFAHVVAAHPGDDVVCADCDGQHSVVDVLRVADRVRTSQASMVLGSRLFVGDVPLRSRLGNSVTRTLFRLATGLRVHDTQTGLRGYPASSLPWLLSVGGDRYEYELDLLLQASASGRTVEEVEIATIYLDDNAASHFRPVVDSLRIYAPLLRFCLASLAAFVVDTVALLVLHAVTGSLLGSVVGARALSSAVNFTTNRRLVFTSGRDKPVAAAAVQYYAVVALLLAGNYALLLALTSAGVALLPAKVLTELTLFVLGYELQRRVVFARPERLRRDPGVGDHADAPLSTPVAGTGARRGRRGPGAPSTR